jgi:hypothetical protein
VSAASQSHWWRNLARHDVGPDDITADNTMAVHPNSFTLLSTKDPRPMNRAAAALARTNNPAAALASTTRDGRRRAE